MNVSHDYTRANVEPYWHRDECANCGHEHAAHLPSHLGNGCRPEGTGRDDWGFPTMVTCRCRGWAVA